MSKNHNLIEVIQFYADNGLDEIISEKSQDSFLQTSQVKIERNRDHLVSLTKVLEPAPSEFNSVDQQVVTSTIATSITKNILPSTFDSISILAKKSQQVSDSGNEKFSSLNDIVARAKKVANAAKNLQELRQAVENFDGCNLKKMATNTVFCDGNSNAKVMVIGEAPGNNEDLQGIPFCGDSGKLLDEMLRSINLTRQESFYITNVIFWRPPGNRKPTLEELAICRPFFERHIQLVKPEIILMVGATAMEALLGSEETISRVRGKVMDFAPKFLDKAIKTFVVFHPSYLMRQPTKKKVAWLDMLVLERFLKKILVL